MDNNSFDLIDLLKLLGKKFKLIFLFTILGLIAAVIFVAVRKNVFTSEANVIVKSYMNFDRKQMFSESAFYVKDVFAKENEIDKAMTILENSDVIAFVAQETDYQKAKNIEQGKVFTEIKRNLKVKRTDNSDLEIKFTDTDPKLALKGLQAALYKAEELYVNYFEDFNKDITKDIDFKRNTLIDSIDVINKQIAEVRASYNLYNALAPVRGNVSNAAPTLSAANAEGIEQLQTLITTKDKLDEEYAKLTSLKSQYNSFLNDAKMHVFYRVSGPYEPTSPSNIPALFIILGCTVAAFIFGCFWVLLDHAIKSRA